MVQGVSEPLIVALDVPTAPAALRLVEQLGEGVTSYKVGLQRLTAGGPRVVSDLVGAGKSVFLDLKLHEIPHSVASAVRVCGDLGVSMVTVHASAGSAVLAAAVDAAAETPGLRILALTVITSLTDEGLAEVGVPGGVTAQVRRLATLAGEHGCHGLVTSPQEVALCRHLTGPDTLIVVPGAAMAAAEDSSDHRRSGTVATAIADGASHVIMGRSITNAADPVAAVNEAKRTISAGLARSGGLSTCPS